MNLETNTKQNSSNPMSREELKDKIMLFPIGVTKPRSFDTRGPWILNEPEEVIKQSLADGELPIDYEHQSSYSQQNGKPAPAAGWIVNMYIGSRDEIIKLNHTSSCDDNTSQKAIIAEVIWTKKAFDMIKNGEYRFISPSFLTNDKQEVSQIIGASLVNLPAITTLPPLLINGNTKSDNIGKISDNIKKYFFQKTENSDTSKLAIALPNKSKNNQNINSIPEKKTQDLNSTHDQSDHDPALESMIESVDSSDLALAHSAIEEALGLGKIIPAQKQYAEICAKTSPQAFTNFLKAATPLADRQEAVSSSQTEKTVLSSVEEEISNALGVDTQLFHKLKN